MPALDGNEEVKLEPEETITKIIKLNPREKKTETELEILTPNKLLTRLPTLLTQIKAGNNSYKLKSQIRQILYPLHQHYCIIYCIKIARKVYKNFIKTS